MLTDTQIALKAATRRAVTLAGGPVAASKALRVDQGRLSRYGAPDDPLYVPIDVALELDRLAGDNIIMRAWAHLAGLDLVDRDVAAQVTHDMTALVGSIALESGELISTTIEAISDGNLTPNEARRIHDEAQDVESKIIQIKNAARKSMCA